MLFFYDLITIAFVAIFIVSINNMLVCFNLLLITISFRPKLTFIIMNIGLLFSNNSNLFFIFLLILIHYIIYVILCQFLLDLLIYTYNNFFNFTNPYGTSIFHLTYKISKHNLLSLLNSKP